MKISLSDAYYAVTDTKLLGYIGEHKARTITFEGLEVEGAERYKLRIEYKDMVSYEIDISSGSYVIDGSLLRSIQTVKAQIYALKSGDEGYELVKKSNIFELEIRPALENEPAPIPTYESAKEYLDEILDYIGGGGGGDGNYNSLANKPKIEGNTLEGDKKFEELGLQVITSAELAAMWN